MADAVHIPDEAETRAKWSDFAWSKANVIIGAIDVVFGECDR